jgi:hypothetical protein
MTRPYPIVDQRSLAPSPKRGRFGMGQRYREADEIPAALAHQVLVYRVNGEYILDRADRSFSHEDVLAAGHVSVVDVRQGYPVVVEFDIPSSEASEFRVRVTFTCTVDDPVQVVRRGVYDAAEVMAGYIKSHHRIFELGLDYGMAQITEVRRDVRAEVQAYTTIRPPMIIGMTVNYLNTEVLTPEELARFMGTRREQRFDHTIATERQNFEHLRQHGGQRQEQERERDRLTYDHDREYEQQRHDQLLATEGQRHEEFLAVERQQSEQMREYERREFERRELAKARELLGDDPLQALRYAFASGKLSAIELAGELQTDKDRRATAEEAVREREREDRLRQMELEREDRLRELQWQREDDRQNVTVEWEDRRQEREDRLRVEQWRHEERQGEIAAQQAKELQQAMWAREDLLRREDRTRADEQRMFDASVQLLQELNKSGHLDLVNFNQGLNRLIDQVTGGPQAENEHVVEAARAPSLPEGDDAADIVVREEDGD